VTNNSEGDVLKVRLTGVDMIAAQQLGATGPETMEAIARTALDNKGVPRERRTATLTDGGCIVDVQRDVQEE
jgi:hypothetical protein